MTTISAKTVLRSRNASAPDKVLSTLLLRYPRWIHAEGRTHRLLEIGETWGVEVRTPSLMECDDLSRNAGSSRALPVHKLIQDVIDDPAEPLYWGMNVAGMQAPVELPLDLIEAAQAAWRLSMKDAIGWAQVLSQLATRDGKTIGAHKQIVNRILEPYSHITVLVSATEWQNFLALRDHPDAEPHIAMLAREIRRELDRTDNIQTLQPGQWHLPFAEDAADQVHAPYLADGDTAGAHIPEEEITELAIKLSVARCASTSYKTVDGFDMTLERAVALHDKLVGSSPLHASPAEHVAQADRYSEEIANSGLAQPWSAPDEHGNFVGFRQYRKMLPNEAVPG